MTRSWFSLFWKDVFQLRIRPSDQLSAAIKSLFCRIVIVSPAIAEIMILGPGRRWLLEIDTSRLVICKLSVYVIYHKSQSEVHAMTDYDMMSNKVYHNNSTIKISEITYLSVLVRSITIPWSSSAAVVVRSESPERSSERESIVLTPNSLNFFHHHTPSYHSSWALFGLCCVFCFAGAMICWVTPSPYRCSIVIVLYGGAMTQKVHRVSPKLL